MFKQAMAMKAAFFVALTSIASPAAPQDFTARQLLAACEPTNDTCIAYIRGFVDGFMVLAPHDRGEPCTIGATTVGEVRAAFVQYLGDHPDALDTTAAAVMAGVLILTYHC